MSSSEERIAIVKERLNQKEVKEPLLERFLRYVKIHTTSDSSQTKKPSTERQFVLGNLLLEELRSLGVQEVSIDEHCYVIGKIPATKGYENVPSIAFMSHIDTSEDCSGENVKPQIHENYDGFSIIEVGHGIFIDPQTTPQITKCIGDTIITSDGTTLLGGDDKCGISEIMTAVDYILNISPFPHGPIEVIFSSDEEIGRGTLYFPIEKISSKFGYTIDGDLEGNYSYENFNAITAKLTFHGFTCHPGDAYHKLINANFMASAFVSMLPTNELPESTFGKDGFFFVKNIDGNVETANVTLFIRDFEEEGIKSRIENLELFAKAVEAKFKGGKVDMQLDRTGSNMYNAMKKDMRVVRFLEKAMCNVGIVPSVEAIRGGTDGSRLSTNYGILTPNIFTGSDNIHSKAEFACLGQMVGVVRIIIELIKIWAENKEI
ncbi:Peptidase T [Histomonas meleagridis]|uniref:Peptidase T n=1 Tax=Histomonas meleagridis TaxID=135588 RepID=UPI0035595EDA|nr:Peptidase T [Histomonas meleagridis]KAH0800055.1 Peptidase T [Histomonas meleagridis]